MTGEAKGTLLIFGLLLLVAAIFGVQAWIGKRWKKEFGAYTVEELDGATRTFYKWVSISAFVAAIAFFLYARMR